MDKNKKLRSIKKVERKQRISEFFDYKHADHKLSYIIGLLQGKFVTCSRKGRVQLALIAKEELLEHGFYWHCERIDNWIHRTAKLEQPKRADLSEERERRIP